VHCPPQACIWHAGVQLSQSFTPSQVILALQAVPLQPFRSAARRSEERAPHALQEIRPSALNIQRTSCSGQPLRSSGESATAPRASAWANKLHERRAASATPAARPMPPSCDISDKEHRPEPVALAYASAAIPPASPRLAAPPKPQAMRAAICMYDAERWNVLCGCGTQWERPARGKADWPERPRAVPQLVRTGNMQHAAGADGQHATCSWCGAQHATCSWCGAQHATCNMQQVRTGGDGRGASREGLVDAA
jgi:hypothetical protein